MARRNKKTKKKDVITHSVEWVKDAIIKQARDLAYGRSTSIRDIKALVFELEAAEVKARGNEIRAEVERGKPIEPYDSTAMV